MRFLSKGDFNESSRIQGKTPKESSFPTLKFPVDTRGVSGARLTHSIGQMASALCRLGLHFLGSSPASSAFLEQRTHSLYRFLRSKQKQRSHTRFSPVHFTPRSVHRRRGWMGRETVRAFGACFGVCCHSRAVRRTHCARGREVWSLKKSRLLLEKHTTALRFV